MGFDRMAAKPIYCSGCGKYITGKRRTQPPYGTRWAGHTPGCPRAGMDPDTHKSNANRYMKPSDFMAALTKGEA